jgi:ribose transport system permease protein
MPLEGRIDLREGGPAMSAVTPPSGGSGAAAEPETSKARAAGASAAGADLEAPAAELKARPAVLGAVNRLPDLTLRGGPLGMLVLLIIVVSSLSPVFLTTRNLGNVLSETSVGAVLAFGQLLVIVTAGIDLSVGANMALCTVLGALVFKHTGSGIATVVTLIGLGLVIGLINGIVFVKGRLPHSFINTLAMLGVATGLALLLSNGEPIVGMPGIITNLGSYVGNIPVSAFLVIALGFLCWVMMRFLVWGRWIYAVGADRQAAQRAGIPVSRVLISVYALSGLAAGFAAAITAAQIAGGSGTVGQNAELDSIAAVIIGGASLMGGRGTVAQALVGALMIGVIYNALDILNVNAFWQYIAVGIVLVLAVEGDVLRRAFDNRRRTAEAIRLEAGR